MLAYNKTELDNLEIATAAEKAFKYQYISAAERDSIIAAHPAKLYTPNIFLRIGIFILTTIIAAFSLGLLALMSLNQRTDEFFSGLVLFFGIICYAVAELLIKEKHHYKSGADDALIYFSFACICSSIILLTHYEDKERLMALIAAVLGVYFSLRFADMIVTAVAFVAVMYLLYVCLPNPWVMMILSLGIYLLSIRLNNKYYTNNIIVLQALSLLTLYAAGNYYIVREVTEQSQDIFWVSTVLIPFIYLGLGIYKKDKTLLRIGLVLMAAVVFTIRYYHSIAPLEVVMTLAGAGMIAIAYILTRYLKIPRKGFTSAEDDDELVLQLESLVIAQTFHKTGAPAEDHFKFGGGTGSGGGASGEF